MVFQFAQRQVAKLKIERLGDDTTHDGGWQMCVAGQNVQIVHLAKIIPENKFVSKAHVKTL